MTKRVTAVYEDGVLRPLSPLELPEHSRVEIDFRELPSEGSDSVERQRIRGVLVNAGLSLPLTQATDYVHRALSESRRHELAQLFSTSGPVSDLISEEREGR